MSVECQMGGTAEYGWRRTSDDVGRKAVDTEGAKVRLAQCGMYNAGNSHLVEQIRGIDQRYENSDEKIPSNER